MCGNAFAISKGLCPLMYYILIIIECSEMLSTVLNALKGCTGILLFPKFLQEPAHSVGSDIGMCHLCFEHAAMGRSGTKFDSG